MENKYESINDLNITQKKIFDVLIEPTNLTLTKQELSDLANVNIKTLRKWMNDKPFMDFVNEFQYDLMRKNKFQVYQALFKSAIEDGRNGFNDRKLYLEIFGDYKNTLEVSGDGLKPIILLDIIPKDGESDEESGTVIE